MSRLQRLKRRVRALRSLRVLKKLSPFIGRWLVCRRRRRLKEVLDCIEKVLAQSQLQNMMRKWLIAVIPMQIIKIQRTTRQFLADLKTANTEVLRTWTRIESRSGDSRIDRSLKLRFLHGYRMYLRKSLRTSEEERQRLQRSFTTSVDTHKFSTRTAIELITSGTKVSSVSVAIIATSNLKLLTESQVRDMIAKCKSCVEHSARLGIEQDQISPQRIADTFNVFQQKPSRTKTKSPKARKAKKRQGCI